MKKILVVDNNPVVLKLMTEFLKKEGHQVTTAGDGLEALDLLTSFVPDVMFIDMVMPKISGDKLCRIIRQKENLKDIRLVILSATAVEDKFDFASFGADACIAKGPFDKTKKHISRVLAQLDTASSKDLANKVIGEEDVFHRYVTTELLHVKKHMEVIFDNMEEGVFEFTPDFRIVYANAAAVFLARKSEEELLSSSILDLFTGEHQERIKTLLQELSNTPKSIKEDTPLAFNDKLISLHCFRVEGNYYNSIVLIMRDITAAKETEKKVEQLKRQQEQLLTAAGEGIYGVDLSGITTFVNPAAAKMLGWKAEQLIGKNHHDLVHHSRSDGTPYPYSECPINATCNDGIIREGTDEFFWRKDGSSFPIAYKSTPIIEDGKIIGAVGTFSDITERKRLETKLYEASITDELTGLLNRRGFFVMSDKLINMADRGNHDLFLLYIDFDNMKLINDKFGHTTGDQAIMETAGLLRDTFRRADVIGRLGGDEFVVLNMDKIGESNEQSVIKRLDANVKKANRRKNRTYKISLSIGIARYDHDQPSTIDELLSRADSSMYEIKERKKKSNHYGGS